MKNEIFYQKAQELRASADSLELDIICDVIEVVFKNNDAFPDEFYIHGHHYLLEQVVNIINTLAEPKKNYSIHQNGDFFFAKINS